MPSYGTDLRETKTSSIVSSTVLAEATSEDRQATAAPTYEFDPLSDSRWAPLVHTHPHASVFHSLSWLRALRDTYGFEPFVITTSPPSAPRLANGLLFCRVNSWLTGRRLVSVPFADHCDALVSSQQELSLLAAHVLKIVEQERWKYVELRSINMEPVPETMLRCSDSYYFHCVDLRPSQQELFAGLHKDCVQRKIKRAQREGLTYEEGNSEALLDKFYKLVVITRRRQSLPPQPRRWFQALIAAFGGNLKIRVASQHGAPVASILTLSHGLTMTYKYGCSDPKFHKLGGMAFLFWQAIVDAKQQGIETLDLGRTDIDNEGLVVFKEHLGGVRKLGRYFRHPYHPSSPVGWKMRFAKQVFAVAPKSALVAVGNLLYPHIG